MDKSMIIIGGGIAGLCTGIYGQMNGYATEIFEMHKIAGGLCTAWKRKGYVFDGCIHWLTGSAPDGGFYDWWHEVGALQGREIVDFDEYARIEGKDGRTLILYSDINKLEKHLKELSPADAPLIEELANAVRSTSKHMMVPEKPQEIMGIIEKLKLLPDGVPLMGIIKKFGGITMEEYAARFSDPFLRDVLARGALGKKTEAPYFLIFTLAVFNNRTAGYPIGGSKPFIEAIVKRYLELGGKIHYKSKVETILVENDTAVGVHMADGREHRADIIVSAADARSTIYNMLGGRYVSDEMAKYYKSFSAWPTIQVSLGVARDFSNEPHQRAIELDEPIEIGGVQHRYLPVHHYCCDPTIAPVGKSVIVSLMEADYDYWKKLKDSGDAEYTAEKERIVAIVVEQLDKRFPGISAQVEAADVATPVTFERYTGNYQGSIMGWVDTPEAISVAWGSGMPTKAPGLNNFHMVGQWTTSPGGLPVGLMTGRYLIQTLCHHDSKRFVTNAPFAVHAR